jgi:hypothetical protein
LNWGDAAWITFAIPPDALAAGRLRGAGISVLWLDAAMSTDTIQNERLRDHDRQLAAIEHNLKLVMAHLLIEWQQPTGTYGMPQEAIDLIARGDRLRAIQVLVRQLGISLAEAKAMVDGKR